MPNSLSKNNKGVTLIEVITVLAVVGVVAAAIVGFVVAGSQMAARVSGEAFLEKRMQTAVEFIDRRIWNATDAGLVDCSKFYMDNVTLEEPFNSNKERIKSKLGIYTQGLQFELDSDTTAYIYTWIDINKVGALLMSSESPEDVLSNLTTVGDAVALADAVKVVYQIGNNAPTTLCNGYILFTRLSDGTVEYTINREEHVVHMRHERTE